MLLLLTRRGVYSGGWLWEDEEAGTEDGSTKAGIALAEPDPDSPLDDVPVRPNRPCCLACNDVLPVPGVLLLMLGELVLAGAAVVVVGGEVDLLGISSDLMILKTKSASVT